MFGHTDGFFPNGRGGLIDQACRVGVLAKVQHRPLHSDWQGGAPDRTLVSSHAHTGSTGRADVGTRLGRRITGLPDKDQTHDSRRLFISVLGRRAWVLGRVGVACRGRWNNQRRDTRIDIGIG